MSLIFYVLIYIFATIFAIFPKIFGPRFSLLIWVFLVLGLSVSIRLPLIDLPPLADHSFLMRLNGEINLDIIGYINKMNDTSWGGHYISREFVFFWLIKSLAIILSYNYFAIFLILDCITFLLLYKALLLVRQGFFPDIEEVNSKYLFFAILIFFPVIIGLHSIYRQLFATLLILISIGYSQLNYSLRSFFIFILSIFSHNVMLIFLPIILILQGHYLKKILAMLIILSMPFVVYFILNSSNPYLLRDGSQIEIGKHIDLYYLIIFIMINMFVFLLNFLHKKRIDNNVSKLLFLILLIYIFCFFGMGSLANQRIAFIFLTLIFLVLGFYFEVVFRQKRFARLLLLNVTMPPLLLYYNVY